MSVFIRTLPNVMKHFGCSAQDAQEYIDLREEGYSTLQAALMAGLSDPPEPPARQELPEQVLLQADIDYLNGAQAREAERMSALVEEQVQQMRCLGGL